MRLGLEMSVTELLQAAQFLMDANGNKP